MFLQCLIIQSPEGHNVPIRNFIVLEAHSMLRRKACPFLDSRLKVARHIPLLLGQSILEGWELSSTTAWKGLTGWPWRCRGAAGWGGGGGLLSEACHMSWAQRGGATGKSGASELGEGACPRHTDLGQGLQLTSTLASQLFCWGCSKQSSLHKSHVTAATWQADPCPLLSQLPLWGSSRIRQPTEWVQDYLAKKPQ